MSRPCCSAALASTIDMKKLFKTPVARYLILTVLAVAIGVNVFSLHASRLAGNAVPMPFGVGASVVLSGSMEPALSVGDLLIIRQQENYETGNIVVYQSGTMPVVHRIVAMSDGIVTTRGDANNATDKPFPADAIKGKVVAAIPLIGYVAWALKSPVAVVIMLAAAVLLVEWSFHTGKSEKEEEKEKLKAEIRALMEELKEE